MLFVNNADYPIPRTNNGKEQFFRKLRTNVRKRNGNTATENIFVQTGVSLALFQNIENPAYVRTVFGKEMIQSLFARHRMRFKIYGLTRASIFKLIDYSINMVINDNLSDNPYSDNVMDMAKASRNVHTS